MIPIHAELALWYQSLRNTWGSPPTRDLRMHPDTVKAIARLLGLDPPDEDPQFFLPPSLFGLWVIEDETLPLGYWEGRDWTGAVTKSGTFNLEGSTT